MGGQIGHHTNLNVRGLNREVPMIIFMTVANHRGFGLALQDFRISPNPARRLDGVVWGFEVADNNLDAANAEAEKQKLRFERFADYPRRVRSKNRSSSSIPTATRWSCAFAKQPSDQAPQSGPVPLRRISHVRVEVTDLEQARDLVRATPSARCRRASARRKPTDDDGCQVESVRHFARCRQSRRPQHAMFQRTAYRSALETKRLIRKCSNALTAKKPIGGPTPI